MNDRVSRGVPDRSPSTAWTWVSGESSLSGEFGHITGVVQRTPEGRGRIGVMHAAPDGSARRGAFFDESFDFDDHNAPGIIELGDDGFLAAWTGHNDAPTVWLSRLRLHEGELSQSAPVAIPAGAPASYAHLLRVDASGARLLLITRALGWNPTGIWIDATTLEPSAPFLLFPWEADYEDPFSSGKGGGRPYVIARQCESSALIALTNDHPRAYRNGVYVAELAEGEIRRLDGEAIRRIDDPSPWHPFDELDMVLEPGGEWVPWVHDIARDAAGRVAVAWSEDRKSPEVFGARDAVSQELRYRVAERRDGTWHFDEPMAAGESLFRSERDYTGGFVFAAGSVDRFALSSPVDPLTGEPYPEGVSRIHLGTRQEQGVALHRTTIGGGTAHALRPRFTRPLGPRSAHALWSMVGEYPSYTTVSTSADLLVFEPDLSCFQSGDTHVDLLFPLRVGGGMPPIPTAAVVAYLGRARNFLEFGAGSSTLLALASSVESIRSVDTDAALLTALGIRATTGASPRFDPLPVFTRNIGDWGYPLGETDVEAYGRRYVSRGLENPVPDLVLIDGRHRLACFLETVGAVVGPTTVLWDDYAERSFYHPAESVLAPVKFFQRLAVFTLSAPLAVPEELLSAAYRDPR